jgi:hypothetical protein
MRAFFLKYIKPLGGLAAGLVCILIFIAFRIFPSLADSIYGQGIYPLVRFLLDFSFGLLSFPAVYLFVLLTIILLIRWLITKSLKNKMRDLLNFTGVVVALFYVLWGFNYARPSIQTRYALHTHTISDAALRVFTLNCIDSLNALRSRLPAQLKLQKPEQTEVQKLQKLVHNEANIHGFNVANNLRSREIRPAGVLRKWGISGIYFPFSGEGLVECNHNLLEKPFIIAHEMAHGFGITDEGEANLLAYLASVKSDNELVKYSAHLAMWQYLRFEIRNRTLFETDSLRKKLNDLVIKDLQFIREDQMLYPEWFPNLSEQVNDAYLKTHGIEEGTDAYQSLPVLFLKYKKAAQQ